MILGHLLLPRLNASQKPSVFPSDSFLTPQSCFDILSCVRSNLSRLELLLYIIYCKQNNKLLNVLNLAWWTVPAQISSLPLRQSPDRLWAHAQTCVGSRFQLYAFRRQTPSFSDMFSARIRCADYGVGPSKLAECALRSAEGSETLWNMRSESGIFTFSPGEN